MTKTRPLPEVGSVHLDSRGGERALRASWHPEPSDGSEGVVILSIWRGNVCTGTVRLTAEELPGLIATLANALDAAQPPGDGRGAGPSYLSSAS